MAQAEKILFSTDREIKNLKASENRYTAKDALANGLFLDITTTGVKSWWYRYSLNGKQERLVLGRYPDLPLKDARQLRDESASLVAKGISPKQNKNKVTSVVFSEYGERYLNEVIRKERKNSYNMVLCLNNDIYPMIGNMDIDKVSVDDVRRVIWRKKDQGYDASANQVRGLLKRMFDYAMTLGLVPYNPVLAIPTRHIYKAVPRDRFLKIDEIRTFYTTLLNSRIYRPRKLGILLSLLTLVRKSELLRAKWEDIDFEKRIWLIPQTKADSSTGHSREMVVYMSNQVIEIFKELKQIAGNEPYVFVGRKSGTHISHNAFNESQKNALKLTNLADFTIHDLRRTASTHLNEQGFNSDAIEACLNHTAKGVRAVYNKAKYEKERTEMLQKWSDFIFSVIYEPNLIFFNQMGKNRTG
ncbi:tyrosine-type recombinase/integrase [Acinetobacter sp. ULE_I046]|uniref:Tyrosine-type recombinase/integrase n=1 Tax=Acinetobacter bereziniae TaxID=106648 RepID=A0A8I1AIS4_ACIBZ|nr:tyrosine-type recombinase/integrase [Acinetobacter bereziniae]QQC84744.1 tyrosine-type recombinase/integrase [Acinetobacter bereziniae]UUN97892.1 tyrosine-type recombinase/integrase [Acinetobacter bereziniae]